MLRCGLLWNAKCDKNRLFCQLDRFSISWTPARFTGSKFDPEIDREIDSEIDPEIDPEIDSKLVLGNNMQVFVWHSEDKIIIIIVVDSSLNFMVKNTIFHGRSNLAIHSQNSFSWSNLIISWTVSFPFQQISWSVSIPFHQKINHKLCLLNSVETEFHFVMECPALEDLRYHFLSCLSYLDDSFTPLPLIDKFKYILCETKHSGIISKNLYNMYKARCRLLNI